MPWRECDSVTERARFIGRLRDGERMSDLCREFGISRKTGYKLWNRWKTAGPAGLFDQSRAPVRTPHETPQAVVDAVLALKARYPTWGAKKLRAALPKHHPGIRVPARSTIHSMLDRAGLVKRRKRRPRRGGATGNLKAGESPNGLWCVDFKGQFRLGDGNLCYPLTVTDNFSRYLIGCEALESTKVTPAIEAFELLFGEYGLRSAIRSDNGVPFATTGLMGWSRLSAWWVKLGIELQRIEPGHPEQNGQHERMHLTLKEETTRPAGANSIQQQERFDRFRGIFNEERPHEALDMAVPASRYAHSTRSLPDKAEQEPAYPLHDDVRRVLKHGHVSVGGRGRAYYLSSALVGEQVGIRELPGDRWLTTYVDVDLGIYDGPSGEFEPAAVPT